MCIEKELPFEIPDSWVWSRLNCCVDVRDGTHDSPKYVQDGIPLITSKNLHDGYLDMGSAKFISQEDHKKISERSRVDNNDILFAMIGSIGNPVLYCGEANKFSIKNMALFKYIHNGMLMKYVYWWLFFSQYAMRKDSSGGVQSFVSLNYLRNYYIPVPPLAEQQRIVAKIEQILPHIKEYELSESRIVQLNATFPEQLKKSILQEAVQGKLVPQDPSDEPASVLLERIREEKARLIKEGKIKKDKNESVIFRRDNSYYEKSNGVERCIDEEIPFEIPNTWKWVRLISICTKLVDGDHNPPKGKIEKTAFIMASSTNINNDTLVELEKVRYLSEDAFRKENERTRVTTGDILFTSVGSLGRSCIFDGSVNICFQRSVSVLTTLLFNKYLKYFFDSGYFQQKIVKEATGTAQKGFYLNQLAVSLIPVPPLAEQQRIVTKVEQLLAMIKSL